MRGVGFTALCAAAAVLGGCEPRQEPDARFVSIAEIKGFDPVFCNDQYSAGAQVQVYEGLYEFDYLKRPLALVPLLAEAMPEVSPDGLVYTFKIRDAVFQDDACFPGGKGRKVTAADFVWCWKRLMADPSSTGSWIFEGKIKGLDDWTKKAQERVRQPDLFDRVNEHYSVESPLMAPVLAEEVAGLRAIDEKTLRVELTEPYPQFMWTTAMNFTAAYPHEAAEHYGIDLMNHPVGTGPYRVEDYWIFDHKITFVRNPTWHGGTYPTLGEGAHGDVPSDKDLGLLDDAGRQLPFLDRIEFVTITESQPRWLRFLAGNLDRVETEREIWEKAMTADGQLRKELADKGIWVQKQPMADIAYTVFNMEDAVIGAPAGERGRKVRQAMCLAYDQALWIKVMRNGFWSVPAFGPVPPGIDGYVEDVKSPYVTRDVPRAKKLLEEAGYPGGRGIPTLSYESNGSDAVNKTGNDIFRNCMKEIGIEVEIHSNTWDQFDDKTKKKAAQVFGVAWAADYPDAQNFLQLFYGPNESPGPNAANYKNPAYDKLYDEMKLMQPGAERNDVIRKMLRIVNEDCPWNYTDHRVRYSYSRSWLKNYKYQDINPWLFKYYRIDREEKARRVAQGDAQQPMTTYIVRRLLYLIPLVLGVALIVSLIFNSGLFGNPAETMLGKHASAEAIQKLTEDLGLNKHWYEQYWDYLKDLSAFDFGRAHASKVRISEMLLRGAIPSLSITLPAFAIATTIAVSLSLLCAAFRGKVIDRAILVAAVGLMSVSSLVYIIFGQYFLAHKLDIGLPIEGYERGPGAWRFLILPIVIFVFLTIGPDLRFYRTAMLEEIKQDYVRTARAKGVSERRVLFHHVLRNGMIPILTRVVVELPFLFLGSLLLERFFSIPGLGGMTITGVLTNDLPVLRAMTFIFAILLVVGNLLTDIAYTIVDPRVRLG